MATNQRAEKPRRPTNVSLSADAVDEAKALGINVSKACETGLLAEVKQVRALRWYQENREAVEAHNAWVEKNGLPLEKYRLF